MTRQEKYNEFQKFIKNSENDYKEISSKSRKFADLNNLYGFHVAPGGRNGGIDDRLVDVFYGHRPIGVKHYVGSNFQIQNKTEIENGCQISFHHLINGKTFVTLYPCNSETFKFAEDFIILDFINNTKKLCKKRIQKKYCKFLNSYMAVTCSENLATPFDRLIVFYLRSFKQLCIKNTVQRSKFYKILKKALTIIFTVGFSGFCLAFIPFFSNSKQLNELTNEVKEINQQLQQIEIVQNELNSKIDFSGNIIKVSDEELADNLDSELDEIKKEIEEINAKIEKKK